METEKGLVAIIMAGGLGKRMNSDLPKVLHKIAGVPMICHILTKLTELSSVKATLPSVKATLPSVKPSVMIVVGKYRQIIEETINNFLQEKDLQFLIEKIQYIDQIEPMGTGHAIQCCRTELLKYPNTNVLILSGDVPLISSQLIMKMVTNLNNIRITVTCLENSTGYGRIVEKDGKFDKIVEEKDCNAEQKTIQKVNCGLYAVDCKTLCRYLPYLKNNNSQNEYYLTDIIEIIKCEERIDVEMCEISKESQHEIMGVNTLQQLEELEKLL